MSEQATAIIALGSNIGDKIAYLRQAVASLSDHQSIVVGARSNLYRTEAWGEEDQDWFVNACVAVTTDLSPVALLRVCQKIENDLGRVRLKRWGPRVIDLDVLNYDDVTQSGTELTLPHPRITERAFVLAPLNDIASDKVINGKTVSEWLTGFDLEGVEKLDAKL